MKTVEFCYWLQGYFELSKAGNMLSGLTSEQVECIQNHLNMCFLHDIDPKAGDASHQQNLNDAHSPPQKPIQTSPFPPQSSDGIKYRC